MIATLAAIIANSLVRILALQIANGLSDFTPLGISPPIMFTLFGGLAATGVYSIIRRWRVTLWIPLSLVALAISFIPDYAIFRAGAPAGGVAALVAMHVIAAGLLIAALSRVGPKATH